MIGSEGLYYTHPGFYRSLWCYDWLWGLGDRQGWYWDGPDGLSLSPNPACHPQGTEFQGGRSLCLGSPVSLHMAGVSLTTVSPQRRNTLFFLNCHMKTNRARERSCTGCWEPRILQRGTTFTCALHYHSLLTQLWSKKNLNVLCLGIFVWFEIVWGDVFKYVISMEKTGETLD